LLVRQLLLEFAHPFVPLTSEKFRVAVQRSFAPNACFRGSRRNGAEEVSGIIADLLVDFANVGASAPGGGDAGDSLFSLVRTLADTKTLACGKNYRSFRAENPYKRKNCPVEQRAALVPKQYFLKACSLDHQVHGTARGTVGPIEAKLLQYGALDGPDAHAAVGLVLGAFGELPTSCYSLCTSIALVAAARLLSFWKMSQEQALELSKHKVLRFWGLTGQRGWARLILDRLHDLVLPPRRFQGQYARPGHGRARTPQFLLSRQRTRCCQCCRLWLA
jgi:hypothetical protein